METNNDNAPVSCIATTEEKKDNKQAEAEAAGASPLPVCAPPKPMEKLVCHLKPAFPVDQVLTPESEHEDAATIAQSIIASEEALLSPTVTSATPTASPSIMPALLQNVHDLSVDTAIPDTPPLPGPVSLAQIGILPSQPLSDQSPPQSSRPETDIKDPKPAVKLVKKKSVDGASKPTKKSSKEPKTPEESTKPVFSEPKIPADVKTKEPKTPEAEPEQHKLVCSIKTKDDSPKTVAEIVLPDDLETHKPYSKTSKPKVTKTDSVEKSEAVSQKSKEEKKPAVKKIDPEPAPKLDLKAAKVETAAKPEEKKEEPSTPVEESAAKPKVKKAVKKVPATPKVKSEGDSEVDVPVPPPRKKVVKPKEKN